MFVVDRVEIHQGNVYDRVYARCLQQGTLMESVCLISGIPWKSEILFTAVTISVPPMKISDYNSTRYRVEWFAYSDIQGVSSLEELQIALISILARLEYQ